MTECSVVTLSDFNNIADLLMRQYNLGIGASLNSEEEQLLDNIAVTLHNIFSAQELNFDVDGFKSLAKKLYPKNSTQFGGDDRLSLSRSYNEAVPSTTRKSRRNLFTIYDFFAILMLLSALFLSYIAYLKVTNMSNALTGLTPEELGWQVSTEVYEAARNAWPANSPSMGWLEFMKKVFYNFGCNIADTQAQHITNLVQTALANAKVQITETVVAQCNSNIASDETMFGTLVNFVSKSLTPIISRDTVGDCIRDSTELAIRQHLRQTETLLASLKLMLKTQSKDAYKFLLAGQYIGGLALTYFMKRLRDIRQGRIVDGVNSRLEIENGSDSRRITNKGGKKSKKYKKIRKHKRKTRKNRRKTRKN